VLKALRLMEWDEETRSDVITLYTTGDRLDRRPDEGVVLERWLAGVSGELGHFRPSSAKA